MNTPPTPAISVIVPVFNVERYLSACLDSLVVQTFDDFEIVVIDDGSTDGSPAIIKQFASMDPDRVRPFTKPNGGLGDARNYGIERARGAFLAFVDADDMVAPTFLAELHGRAVSASADIVLCGILNVSDDGEPDPYLPEPDMSVFGHSLAEETRLLFRVDASACDKLYARDLFERTGIRFPVGVAFEDVPTVYRLLACAVRVEKIDRPLYYYRRHRAESISSGYGAEYLDLIEAFRRLGSFYDTMGIFEANRDALLRLHLTHLVAGRYPDLFLWADVHIRSEFIRATYALLDVRFSGWRDSSICRDLWQNPVLRAISTHDTLLAALCGLPPRVYLGVLSRIGAFDPKR